ncbi:MAG: VOC family protein [Solobacterium sp.]|nr:VOC family protein [Solobacterium sp.]
MNYSHVHQLGFVVRDMEKAMEEYGKIYHIKTWYRAGKRLDDEMYYMGKRIADPGFDLIVGYCGNTEIELITTTADEGLYAAFLKEGREGLHHVSFFVNDLAAAVKEYEGYGFQVVQNGYMTGKTERTYYAYMARPGEGAGRIIEFSSTVFFGRLPLQRNRRNMFAGVLTGNAEVAKRMR